MGEQSPRIGYQKRDLVMSTGVEKRWDMPFPVTGKL